jgi:hypothetical protein
VAKKHKVTEVWLVGYSDAPITNDYLAVSSCVKWAKDYAKQMGADVYLRKIPRKRKAK